MKRFLSVLMIFALCFSMISCDELLSGIGNDSGRAEDTKGTEIFPIPPDTWYASDTEISICVDWSDFVRVNGVSYDGMFENITVDESRVGEKLGEILYHVKSYYSSYEEMNAAEKRDFTASFRPIGCEIFAVKDDENSIVVLDGDKYYLYTLKIDNSVPFSVFGGEEDYLSGFGDRNVGFTVNTPLELGERFGGCEEPTPEELAARYGGDRLNDITLVVVRLVSGAGGTEFGIESVSKAGDDLLVNVVRLDSDAGGDDAIHYWTFYIEIPKTDDKNVVMNFTTVKPLENDRELTEISLSAINNYVCYDPEVDYGRYEGKAVLNKGAAEELVRSTGAYDGYSAFVRFCPTNNYWLVSLSRFGESSSNIVDTVVRAADGRIISQIEAIGCG